MFRNPLRMWRGLRIDALNRSPTNSENWRLHSKSPGPSLNECNHDATPTRRPFIPRALYSSGKANRIECGLERGVPIGDVHQEPPPTVILTPPNGCILERHLASLTTILLDPHYNGAQRVAEVARGRDFLERDFAAGVRMPSLFALDLPELLDGTASQNRVCIFGHEFGIGRVERGHSCRIACVEQRFKVAGELLHFVLLESS